MKEQTHTLTLTAAQYSDLVDAVGIAVFERSDGAKAAKRMGDHEFEKICLYESERFLDLWKVIRHV